MTRRLASEGLTERHLIVLAAVAFFDLSRVDEVARATGLRATEVERLCSDLEAAGCVVRPTLH